MAYWLVKSEPDVWSFDQQMKKGAKGEPWTGVRNFTARANLTKMKKGDKAFFYHSNEGLEIVGIVTISKPGLKDPTDPEGKWAAVKVKPVRKLKRPVTLKEIKADAALADMELVRQSRLSVAEVRAAEWEHILGLARR